MAGNWLWSRIVNRKTAAPTPSGAPLGNMDSGVGVRNTSQTRTPSPRRTSTPAKSSIERPTSAVISGFATRSPDRKVTPMIETRKSNNSSASSFQQDDKGKTSTDEGRRSAADEALEVLRVEGLKLQEVIHRLGSSILGQGVASTSAENYSMDEIRLWNKED